MSTDARKQIYSKRPSLGPQIVKQENVIVLFIFIPLLYFFLLIKYFLSHMGGGASQQFRQHYIFYANNLSGDPHTQILSPIPQKICWGRGKNYFFDSQISQANS